MSEETHWWFLPEVDVLVDKVQAVAPFKAEAIFDVLANTVFLLCHEGRAPYEAVTTGIHWTIRNGYVSYNSEVARFIDWETKTIDDPKFEHDAVAALLEMLRADVVLVNIAKAELEGINARGHEFSEDDIICIVRRELYK